MDVLQAAAMVVVPLLAIYLVIVGFVTGDNLDLPKKVTGTCGSCIWELALYGHDIWRRYTYSLLIYPVQDAPSASLADWLDEPPWHGDLDGRVVMVMVAPGVKARTCKKMFSGFTHLRAAYMSSLDTSNVKSMSCMFFRCHSLKKLDLGGWDTSNVTDMSYMFYGCRSLRSLDVSMLDASSMPPGGDIGAFYGCPVARRWVAESRSRHAHTDTSSGAHHLSLSPQRLLQEPSSVSAYDMIRGKNA